MPARLHRPLKVPVLFVTSGNEPVGVIGVPGELSLIAMLQVSGFPISAEDEQLMPVMVLRWLTVMAFDVPELVLCVRSPL